MFKLGQPFYALAVRMYVESMLRAKAKFWPGPNSKGLKMIDYMLHKTSNSSPIDLKTWWKRQKCWLSAFSPFPFYFFNALFLSAKSRDCVVKG